jgi:hypothetical protein
MSNRVTDDIALLKEMREKTTHLLHSLHSGARLGHNARSDEYNKPSQGALYNTQDHVQFNPLPHHKTHLDTTTKADQRSMRSDYVDTRTFLSQVVRERSQSPRKPTRKVSPVKRSEKSTRKKDKFVKAR